MRAEKSKADMDRRASRVSPLQDPSPSERQREAEGRGGAYRGRADMLKEQPDQRAGEAPPLQDALPEGEGDGAEEE
jgi:hypothetical protein